MENVPAEMKTLPRWVCWKPVPRGDRVTKIPYNPTTGREAASNDSSTWVTYEVAVAALKDSAYAGIGFMLGSIEDGGPPYCGIDLDKCVKDGVIEPWVQQIINGLDSYTELSPSGSGVHVICRAKLPPTGRRKGPVEMYDSGRYFTVSGRYLGGQLSHRQAEIDRLHLDIFGVKPLEKAEPSIDHSLPLADRLAILLTQDPRLEATWERKRSDFTDQSASVYDLALASTLATAGFSDTDILEACRLWRTKFSEHPEKVERLDYASNLLTKAKTNIKAAFPMTDLGNAERLVVQYGRDLKFCDLNRSWYLWDNTRWAQDETRRIEDVAKRVVRTIYSEALRAENDTLRKNMSKHAIKSEGVSRLRALIDLARSQLPVLPSELDRQPMLINVLNGTLNLATGKLLSHDRSYLMTKMCPVNYDPDARSELWEKVIQEACPEWQFLQRAFGYSITGNTREKKLFFLHGPTDSGKSTILSTVRLVMGDYARTADVGTFLINRGSSGARPEIARLEGARLVSSIEVQEGTQLAEGLVNLLTGGDEVSARHLYQSSREFVPRFKIWLAANLAPHINPADDAIWNRIIRVPFEKLKDVDRSVKERLAQQEEWPGIFNWLVQGCLSWQGIGLEVPQALQIATEEERREQNPVQDFIDSWCDISNPGASTDISELYQAFRDYCDLSGYRYPPTLKKFDNHLRTLGFSTKVITVGETTRKVFAGIRLAMGGVRDLT